MRAESGRTTSVWHATAGELRREPLATDARADVCIVGGGIAGMVTGWLLVRAGRQVIILDDGPLGGGETGRTTAHLSDALDDRYATLERLHGAEGARLAAESHRAGIELLDRIRREEGIDCDFTWVDGYLFPADDAEDADHAGGVDRLRSELDAARRAGVAVQDTDQPAYAPFTSRNCLRFERQARFHPLRFIEGVARAIEAAGGRIYTDTRATAVHGGAPVRVETAGDHVIRASACVVATNSPITDYVVTHAKQAPYRTFVIAARVPRGSVPDALYWEDADPYLYIRLQQGEPQERHDWVIVGGEDYKTGQKEDDSERLDRLERWTRKRFPMAESIDYRWSGQVLEPSDGLGFIGPNPDGAENVYIITGDSGHGMTNGALGGLLLTDLILGRQSAWARLYDPKRMSLRAVADLAKENLNVAAQYTAWVLPGDVPADQDVPAGEGRVVRRGTKLVAVYRDDAGQTHQRSAVCTHLRCIVNWNDLEKSWDCPCHGSRFDPYGEVLNGPANEPLGEAD